jgi:AraC-like DNA-binding protein
VIVGLAGATRGLAVVGGTQLAVVRLLTTMHRVDAARLVHVTVGAFSRWFKREIGRTFTDYVNDARCGAACDRLLRTDVSIARIADQCGFATLSNFNAQFKRRYGCTPRGFRLAR